MNRENPAAGIRGRALDVDLDDELQHFELCQVCGQAFDLRDIEECLYHDTDEHDRLPTH